MTTTMREPMTQGEIINAARVILGATRELPIRWMQDIENPSSVAPVMSRGGNVMRGVLRRIVDAPGSVIDARAGTDIRDQFVHVSATFELWLPIADLVIAMMNSTADIES